MPLFIDAARDCSFKQTYEGYHVYKATSDTAWSVQVIAVGSGKGNEKGEVVKPTLSKGDTVLYQKYSGVDFEGEGETSYVVLKESDILASLA